MAVPGEPLRWDDPDLHWDDPRLRWDQPFPATQQQMNNNKVSAELTAQAVTAITGAVTTIRTNLPFLVHLTEEERRDLPKMGSGSQGVVSQALVFVGQNPGALPANFNTAEFNKDGALLSPMQQVAQLIGSLNEDVQDTLLALNSDLFMAFLEVYAFSKANNRDGRYDSFINLVKGRFARKAKTTPTPPTPPTP